MNSKNQLLSTVQLDQSLIAKAVERGIVLDCIPFIKVEIIKDKEIATEVERLCSLPVIAAFTSVHAVYALSKSLYIHKPDWDIYCVGNATRNALLEYFHASAIKGCANDAAALAEVILMDDISEVFFFCGDKRLDTLPELLTRRQVLVHEVTVYQTMETPHAIGREYDGILFFSPSGVHSFFSVNKLNSHAVLFAIGHTTAAAISEHTGNAVVISETPSKEHLVLQALQYFYQQTSAHNLNKTE